MSNPQGTQDVPLLQSLGQFWTAANMLSLSRVVLAFPVTYLILIDGPVSWIFGLILLAGLTDFFDGRVARWSHTVSDWGKVLDPLADKFSAVSVALALVIRGSLPIWFAVLVLLRDTAIVAGSVLVVQRGARVMMSLWWGKIAVTALAVTMLLALLKADPPVLQVFIWVTAALMVYTWFLYGLRMIRYLRTGELPAEETTEQQNSAGMEPIQPKT